MAALALHLVGTEKTFVVVGNVPDLEFLIGKYVALQTPPENIEVSSLLHAFHVAKVTGVVGHLDMFSDNDL